MKSSGYWSMMCLALVASGCADLSQDPNEPKFEFYQYKGRAYMERGNPQVALPSLRKAQELEPDNVEILLLLGMAYDQLGRSDQAATTLERAHKLRPQDGAISNNLGVAYLHRNRLTEAEPHFREALRDSKWDTPEEAWFNLGLLRLQQGNQREMVTHMERALGINPGHVPAQLELAKYYHTVRRYDLEQNYLRAVLNEKPERVDVVERLATSLRQSGDKEQAERLMEQIKNMAPAAESSRNRSR